MSNKNLLITLSGPSLTGKTKLADALLPYGFEELVSTTTRPPRKGEVNGISYNFISVEKFEELIASDLMIEHVKVGNNYYGISKQSFEDVINNGKNGVSVIEPQGAKRIREYCERNDILLFQVFINNPLEVLVKRMFERYKNDSLANDDEYSRRIIDMFNLEQKNWVQPALSGEQKYDLVFENFNINSENAVIQEVLQTINEKILKKNVSKRLK